MNPGYFGQRCVPYFSPIYVTRVTPLKTGKGILEMDFFNACYVEGVQNFDGMRLKVLLRAENYLIGHLLGNDPEVRSAVIRRCRGDHNRPGFSVQLPTGPPKAQPLS
jgi:hypothetical protein